LEIDRRTLGLTKIVAPIVIILMIVGLSWSSLHVEVQGGERAVKTQWGKPVDTLGEGFHWILWFPPFGEGYEIMDVTIQKAESAELTASRDLQEITTTVAINYHLDPTKVMDIYRDFRHDYAVIIVKPSIEEGIKAVTSEFTAEQLVTHRADVKNKLDIELSQRLDKFNIIVDAVSITDFQFSDSFSNAIDDKVEQEQIALTEKNKLLTIEYQAEQRIINANATAKAQIATAEGQAQADIIEAQGEATARILEAESISEANKLLADAVAYEIQLVNQNIADNPYYIQYIWTLEWDGRLPQTVFGDENIELLLNMGG